MCFQKLATKEGDKEFSISSMESCLASLFRRIKITGIDHKQRWEAGCEFYPQLPFLSMGCQFLSPEVLCVLCPHILSPYQSLHTRRHLIFMVFATLCKSVWISNLVFIVHWKIIHPLLKVIPGIVKRFGSEGIEGRIFWWWEGGHLGASEVIPFRLLPVRTTNQVSPSKDGISGEYQNGVFGQNSENKPKQEIEEAAGHWVT